MNREIIFDTYYLDTVSLPAKYSFSLKTISDLKRALAGLGAKEMVATDHLRTLQRQAHLPSPCPVSCLWPWPSPPCCKHGDGRTVAPTTEPQCLKRKHFPPISSHIPSQELGRCLFVAGELQFQSTTCKKKDFRYLKKKKKKSQVGKIKISLKSLKTAAVGWNPGAWGFKADLSRRHYTDCNLLVRGPLSL